MKFRKFATLTKALQAIALALALLGFAAPAPAQAGADLQMNFTMPDGEQPVTDVPFTAIFQVSNVGDETANSVTVQVDIPEDLGGNDYSDMEVAGSGVVFPPEADGYTIDALPAGTSVSYIYTLMGTVSTSHIVTAGANMSAEDPTPLDNWAGGSLFVEEDPYVDLEVTVAPSTTPLQLYDTTVLEVICTNAGSSVARDVRCTLASAQVLGRVVWENLSASSSKGTVAIDDLYVINSGFELQPGESATMQVTVKVLWVGDLNVRAFVSDEQKHDLSQANNTSSAILTVQGTLPVFDLAASLKMSPSVVQPGGLLVEQLTISNLGPDDVTSVTLFAQVDDLIWNGGVLNVPALHIEEVVDAGPWQIRYENHYMYGHLPYLAAGSSATLSVVMKLADDYTSDTVSHALQVRSDWWIEMPAGSDPYDYEAARERHKNNTAYAQVQVNLNGDGDQSDLEITQTAPSEVPVGQTYSYTVKATNNGPHPSTSGYISNVFSDSVEVVSVASDKGKATVAGRYISVEDAPLAVGESVTLRVAVVPRQLGEELYSGTVASSAFDPDLANNNTAAKTLIKADGTVVYPDDPNVDVPEEEDPVVNPVVPCVDMPDLVANMTKVSRKGKSKKKTGEWNFKVQAKVEITNIGTGCALGKSVVHFYLSDDTILNANDTLIGGKQVKELCPPKNAKKGHKSKKVSFKTKLAPGINPVGRYIIAVADADKNIAECNEDNNMGLSLD